MLEPRSGGSRLEPPRIFVQRPLEPAAGPMGSARSPKAPRPAPPGRRVGPLDRPGRIDDHDRIGDRVDRGLCRLLVPHSRAVPAWRNSRIVRAIALKAPASSPSSSRVLPGTTWSRSPPAIALRAARHRPDRLQDRPAHGHRHPRGDAAVASRATIITRFDLAAACLALPVLRLHVRLVDLEHLVRVTLDLHECLEETFVMSGRPVETSPVTGMRVKDLALLEVFRVVGSDRFRHLLSLSRQGDVVLFPLQVLAGMPDGSGGIGLARSSCPLMANCRRGIQLRSSASFIPSAATTLS